MADHSANTSGTIAVPDNVSVTYTPNDGPAAYIGLAWPFVVLIALWRLEKPIIDFINRANSLEAFGAKLQAAPPQELSSKPPEKPPSGDLEEPPSAAEIKADSGSAPGPLEAPSVPATKNASVDRDKANAMRTLEIELQASEAALTQWRRSWQFERIFGELYGSQRDLLIDLFDVGVKTMSELIAYYNDSKVKLGTTQPFDEWLNYLINQGLIEFTSTYRNSKETRAVALTPFGDQFVRYMKAQKLDKIPKAF